MSFAVLCINTNITVRFHELWGLVCHLVNNHNGKVIGRASAKYLVNKTTFYYGLCCILRVNKEKTKANYNDFCLI